MLPLKNVAVLGECCSSGRNFSLNLLVLIFVSGGVSLSQVDVAFNVLDLSVVDIYWCVTYPDFNFHQQTPVTFVIVHVVHCEWLGFSKMHCYGFSNFPSKRNMQFSKKTKLRD